MYTIGVTNQKGGVAKTTTTTSVAAALAKDGARVLAIDMDPQANLTLALGIEPEVQPITIASVLAGTPLIDAVIPTAWERLSVVAADITLASCERKLYGEIGFDEILRRQLSALEAQHPGVFDVVVIDCPPSLGLLTVNAVTASDVVLVPVQCEYFSARGVVQLLDLAQAVRDRRNPELQVRMVPTLFDKRNRICRQVLEELHQAFAGDIVETVIGIDTRLREAAAAGVPIGNFSPRSRAARSYRSLARELFTPRSRKTPGSSRKHVHPSVQRARS